MCIRDSYGTVSLVANVGYQTVDDGTKEYVWHRFGSPVVSAPTVTKDPDVPTALYRWDYEEKDWKVVSGTAPWQTLIPFTGYALTTNQEQQTTTYTFTGQLVGNADSHIDFEANGYNFFANSYTGYSDIKTMLSSVMENPNAQKSVWVWDRELQRYVGVSESELNSSYNEYKEIAPLETFILQLRDGDEGTVDVDYASAIWGNPTRRPSLGRSAQRRVQEDVTGSGFQIVIRSSINEGDKLTLLEDVQYTPAFDNGYDVTKYMDKGAVNLYATTGEEELSTVATDDLRGILLSLQTRRATSYTLTFKNVYGMVYGLEDTQTGAVVLMTEGATYTFTAEPNSTIRGRFRVVEGSKVTTYVEDTTADTTATTAKGIYSVTGQYLGNADQQNTLPAGVYIINGKKVVK